MTLVRFESIPIHDNGEPLVDLAEYSFMLETVYFNRGYSQLATHLLRRGVAEKLAQAQAGWNGEYRFKIWDGWRSREVQDAIYQEFWQDLKTQHSGWSDEQLHRATEQFVTKADNPQRIPPHATGGTVDLTLVDRRGDELDMGTAFDHFGPEAAPHYFDNTNPQVAANRQLLADAMLAQGFTADDDEWWHFDYGCQLWAVRAGQSVAVYDEARQS